MFLSGIYYHLLQKRSLRPSACRFSFDFSISYCGYPRTISHYVSDPRSSSRFQCTPNWFLDVRSPVNLDIFYLFCPWNFWRYSPTPRFNRSFYSGFSAFGIVQVSAPFRTALHTKLFISDFLVSKLVLFEVRRFPAACVFAPLQGREALIRLQQYSV